MSDGVEAVRMSAAEAAAMIGISPEVVRRLAREGKIRYVRPGVRKMWFYRSDIEKFLKARTVAASRRNSPVKRGR